MVLNLVLVRNLKKLILNEFNSEKVHFYNETDTDLPNEDVFLNSNWFQSYRYRSYKILENYPDNFLDLCFFISSENKIISRIPMFLNFSKTKC